MDYAITPTPIPTVAVAGSDERYPVRRIYCVGVNYAAHAVEMGRDEREPPFFFTKFPDTVVASGAELSYPPQTSNYHHEIELVVAIGEGGAFIKPEQALEHVFGYAVGLDMTRRDLQQAAKEKRRPWDIGKSFDQSAPISPIHRVEDCGHFDSGRISLSVNGEIRQDSDVSKLIWNVAEVIAHLSTFYRLCPGDLIFTGTPAGVGPVVPGDKVEGEVVGLDRVAIQITPVS